MIQFILNNKDIKTELPAGTTLLDFIRYHQHLMGTKIGCREGDCGACTILIGTLNGEKMDYLSATSCLTPLGNIQGKHVVTVEGINPDKITPSPVITHHSSPITHENTEGVLTPIQKAMSDESATQCGFCTVGFVMSLTGFCMSDEKPTQENAIAAIDGNICRCTGYKSIERAALRIAELKQQNQGDSLDFCIENKVLPPYFSNIKSRLATISKSIVPINHNGHAHFVGGGTDLYVQKHDEMTDADIHFVLNHSNGELSLRGTNVTARNVAELRGGKIVGEYFEINSSATVTDLKNSEVLNAHFPNLQQHLKLVSSTPIRNIATIAGNLVNASPIGDLSVFLLVLDTILILNDNNKQREVELKDFFKGYKTIDKTPTEMIEKIKFKLPSKDTFFNFEKVCKRTYLDIASVNCAISLKIKDNYIEKAEVAMGGVAPIPLFLKETAAFLIGQKADTQTAIEANNILQKEIAPISDVRGSADYKRLLARQLFIAHFEIVRVRWDTD